MLRLPEGRSVSLPLEVFFLGLREPYQLGLCVVFGGRWPSPQASVKQPEATYFEQSHSASSSSSKAPEPLDVITTADMATYPLPVLPLVLILLDGTRVATSGQAVSGRLGLGSSAVQGTPGRRRRQEKQVSADSLRTPFKRLPMHCSKLDERADKGGDEAEQ